MSASTRVPVCVTLPPALIERADRIAEAEERSRSFIVSKALEAFCNSQPGGTPLTPETAGPSGTAAGAGAPSRLPAAASYPASLHIDAQRRGAAVHTERAAVAAEHRDRVLTETAENLKGITE